MTLATLPSRSARLPSKRTPKLDPGDRRLLLIGLGIALVLAILLGVLSPRDTDQNNPLPSTYRNTRHGASAAYQLLLSSGYDIVRWEEPLRELAGRADASTVVILAQPFPPGIEDDKAIFAILNRGGRVLATGPVGASLLPDGAVEDSSKWNAACKASPEGFNPLAASGEMWMVPEVGWKTTRPGQRIDYTCAGQPIVVEYDVGKGHAIWWASSTPLENGSIPRANNLEFFLNSLGPRQGRHFYWDESLHGESRTYWHYAQGPAFTLLLVGVVGIGLLLVLSRSRRSGPVRAMPAPTRLNPVEFLSALGSLYRQAGATATVLSIAYERFRGQMTQIFGLRDIGAAAFGQKLSARDLAMLLNRRACADPLTAAALEEDLLACEQAGWGETLSPRQALALVRRLHAHARRLRAVAIAGRPATDATVPLASVSSTTLERPL